MGDNGFEIIITNDRHRFEAVDCRRKLKNRRVQHQRLTQENNGRVPPHSLHLWQALDHPLLSVALSRAIRFWQSRWAPAPKVDKWGC